MFRCLQTVFVVEFCSLKLDDSNNDDSTDDKEDEDGDSTKKVSGSHVLADEVSGLLV